MSLPEDKVATEIKGAVYTYDNSEEALESESNSLTETSFWTKLDHKIQVSDHERGSRWCNSDMEPTPPERQTWRPYNYVLYWISDSYNAAGWRTAASMIEKGLSPGMTYLTNILGHIIIAGIVTVNGLVGSRYHVGFTVQARAAFGFYFSYVVIFMRLVVAAYYYGTNAYTGAECVQSMIYAMAPSFKNLKNTIPGDSTTTSLLICYVIYFIISMPFHLVRPENIRWFFTFKAIFCPITGFVLMAWLSIKAGGTSAIWNQGNTAKGTAWSWLMMQAVATAAASYSTLGVNVNDFTRYARNYKAPYAQLYAIPVIHGAMTPMGIVGAAATKIIYGTVLWDPLEICDEWITTPRGRCAAFFVALSFLIAQIGINISGNSISAANDLTALFPKYVNIRRGQVIVALLGGWALCPWEVLSNATTLTAFMGGYSIFLGPIASILICDYWLIHKAKYDANELYNHRGIYKYNRWGTNWRVLPALAIGFAPLLPGLAHYINASLNVSEGALHLYLIGYCYSFPTSFLVYYATCKIWPPYNVMVDEAVIPPSHTLRYDPEDDINSPKIKRVAKKIFSDVVY